MKIENFAFIIILIFSFIGIITSAIGAHEFYHVYEFKQLNITSSRVCILQIDNITKTGGYYEYIFPREQKLLFENLNKFSEVKAYSISILVTSIGIISMFLAYRALFFKKEVIK